MPLMKCTSKEVKDGWKYGKSGKCYTDKEKAVRQMKAMYANGYRESADILFGKIRANVFKRSLSIEGV